MSQSSSRKNELLAGSFVLAMVVAAVGALFLLNKNRGGGAFGPPPLSFDIEFPPKPGIRGLARQSPVQYGGFQVGSVTDININKDSGNVVVSVSIRPDLAITDQARVAILTNPLSGGGMLDIRELDDLGKSKGQDNVRGRALSSGATLPAEQTTVTDVLVEDALRGLGLEDPRVAQDTTRELRDTLSHTRRALVRIEEALDPKGDLIAAVRNVRQLTEPERGELSALLREVRAELASGDLRRALVAVRELTERFAGAEWKERFEKLAAAVERVDAVLTKAESLLDTLDKSAKPVLDKASVTLDRASSLLTRADLLLERNSDRIDTAVRDGAAAAADLRLVMADVAKSRAHLTAALANLDRTAELTRELVEQSKPGVDLAVRDLRTAAADLKKAVLEIKTSPWRLLLFNYDEKLLANSNVLDAARVFNDGAAGLEDSVRRLEALLAVGKLSDAERARVTELLKEIRQRTAKLGEAESRLFDKLK